MEESIKSFVERTGSDLLTFYTRDFDSHINEGDVKIICDLVDTFQTPGTRTLNILLHTEGGNINAAIGLIEFLRSKYPLGISSIVMVVAKSSGSFMAVSASKCYMHTGSVLGDFTLNQGVINNIEYTDAQRRSAILAYSGICGKMPWDFFSENFIFNTHGHGKIIPKAVLLDKSFVSRLKDFSGRTKALAYVHNTAVDFFHANKDVKKIYGLNENIYFSNH